MPLATTRNATFWLALLVLTCLAAPSRAQSFADLVGPRQDEDKLGKARGMDTSEFFVCGESPFAVTLGAELPLRYRREGFGVNPSIAARGVFQLSGAESSLGTSLGIGFKFAPLTPDGTKTNDIVEALKNAEGGDIAAFLNLPMRICGRTASWVFLPTLYGSYHDPSFFGGAKSFLSLAFGGRLAVVFHEVFGDDTPSFSLSGTVLHYLPFGNEASLAPLRAELGDGVGARLSLATILSNILEMDMQIELTWEPLKSSDAFELRVAFQGTIR